MVPECDVFACGDGVGNRVRVGDECAVLGVVAACEIGSREVGEGEDVMFDDVSATVDVCGLQVAVWCRQRGKGKENAPGGLLVLLRFGSAWWWLQLDQLSTLRCMWALIDMLVTLLPSKLYLRKSFAVAWDIRY